jgi:hypothetical protein
MIGRAQAMLVDTYGETPTAALMEIADRAERDEIGLYEAALQISHEGASSRHQRHKDI